MPANARIAHHVPGRVRIRVAGGKNNRKLLQEIKQALLAVPGIKGVEVHCLTGSLVIYHTHTKPKQFRQSLSQQGDSSGLFHLTAAPDIGEAGEMYRQLQQEAEFLAAHSELASTLLNETKKLDNAIKRATGNELDLKVLVPLGLAIYSALEFGAEVSTPLWVTLGIFAFNSFVALHSPAMQAQAARQTTAAQS